jgi:predicted transposase YdaD
LTRDGTGEAMIHKALDAIEGRAFRSSAERADHLAVLWFVAEAEDVPVRVLRAYISEERLMESTLYQSAFAKGEAQGEARGEARAEARLYVETIVQILVRWLNALDPALSERLGAVADRLTLKAWHQEALYLSDAEGARRLAEKIQKAPLP